MILRNLTNSLTNAVSQQPESLTCPPLGVLPDTPADPAAAAPDGELPGAPVAQVSEDAYQTALNAGSAQSVVSLQPEPDRAIFPADPSPGQVSRNITRQANQDLSLGAALVSLARKRPEAITGLISAKAGDTYTVNLPGHDKPLSVVQPGPVDSGTWVKVLEKAYTQTHADGSVPADPIFTLTGHYVDLTHLNRMTDDETRAKIGNALGKDKVVSAYDSKSHETWSVSAYDHETDTVSLRSATGRPALELSLGAFRQQFGSITIES